MPNCHSYVHRSGFSLGRLHMGGFVTPYGGGQVQGDKALMGGLMRGDIDLMGGPNFDISYTKSTVNVKLQLHDVIY